MIDSEYGDDSGIDDEFVEKFQSGRADDGYGMLLDKGTQEQREMAHEFNGDVEVGGPIEEQGAEGMDLPPAADVAAPGESDSEAPIIAPASEQSEPEANAAVVVGAPIAAPEVVATPLPAASGAKKAASDMDGMKFGEVFKHFRGKGDKSFQWRGKTYTTALKAESARGARSIQPQAKAASDQKTADAAVAAEVFQQPDAAPKSRPPLKKSTSGIGPKLTGMLPRPGARNIYEGAGVTLADPDKRAKPVMVTGKDGQQRTAESMADLMASRKAEIAARNNGAQGV